MNIKITKGSVLKNKSIYDKLIFEKVITRDWSLVTVEMLHSSCTQEFKKQFGFYYTDMFFDFHNGLVDIYRSNLEHKEKMTAFVLEGIKKDKNFISNCSSNLIEYCDIFYKKIDKINQIDLSQLSNLELLNHLSGLLFILNRLTPTFLIVLWFPINMDGNQNEAVYKDHINVAIDIRNKIDKIPSDADFVIQKILEEFSFRIYKNKIYSKYLSIQDVSSFSLQNILKDENEIIKRLNSGFVYGGPGIKYLNIKDYIISSGYLLKDENDHKKIDLIKGQCAYVGLTKGIIRLITTPDKYGSLIEGEIIVSYMTTPNMFLDIKKSSAIITDEGGVTCHAAIIAREMKKPCIVGTKIATKVLKDGDLVEVDADNGVVRILN